MLKNNGFTLIELMVVVAIIAVLAVMGATVYRGLTKQAKDASRTNDVYAISRAYELKYDLGTRLYQPISQADFSSGVFPRPPEGGDYSGLLPASAAGFQICAALENSPTRPCNVPSSTCFCIPSIHNNL